MNGCAETPLRHKERSSSLFGALSLLLRLNRRSGGFRLAMVSDSQDRTGFLNTEFGLAPFVPEGKSFWEIGTGIDARAKATSDYRELTETTPDEVRRESTFVFVTPLSGRKDWQHTWKPDGQAAWVRDRRRRNEWLGVCVIDGSQLIDWLQQFPAVELWLARAMGLPANQIGTPEQRWHELKTIGDPHPASLGLLLNRDAA